MNWQWDDFEKQERVTHALIDAFDPRLRVLALLAVAAGAVAARENTTLLAMLVVSLLLIGVSGLSLLRVLRRLWPLGFFGVVLFLVLPWTVPGQAMGDGLLSRASWDGLSRAWDIWVRAAVIVLSATGLVGTLEIPVVGHVLAHFRLPPKFVHLVLFSVRYLKVLEDEYQRLHTAMRMRGFRPGCNRWTFRVYGQLVGMLIVRSLERSERILTAMKCRGFRGSYYLWQHFHYRPRDLVFVIGMLLSVFAYLRWEQLL